MLAMPTQTATTDEPPGRDPLWRRDGRRLFLAIFGAVLAVEVVKNALLFAIGPPVPQMDASAYWERGRQIASGDVWMRENLVSYLTPGQPAFLAFCQAVFGRYALAAASGLQHAMVVLTALLTAWMCGRLSANRWVALAGLTVSACCIARPYYANAVLTETLFTFLITFHLAVAIHYQRSPTFRSAMAMGASVGLSILVRPIAQLLWLPVFAVTFTRRSPEGRIQWRVAARHAAMAGLVIAVIVAPWFARNWRYFGEPFLTKFTGRNLWIVTFQSDPGAELPFPTDADGQRLLELLQDAPNPVDLRHTWSVSNALRERGVEDTEIDELMLSVCLSAIEQRPLRFGFYALKRFANFWRTSLDPFPYYAGLDMQRTDYQGQYAWRNRSLEAKLAPILDRAPPRFLRWNELATLLTAIGVFGLLYRRDTRRAGLTIALTLAYFSVLTAALEIPNYRYRMILEPLMIVAICSGIYNIATLVSTPCSTGRRRAGREHPPEITNVN